MKKVDRTDPRSFADIIGQREAVARLDGLVPSPAERATTHDWRERSIVLCGPPHSGKRTLSAIYAGALLCTHSDPSPCGACADCRDMRANQHRNLRRLIVGLDAESEILTAILSSPASTRMSGGHAVVVVERADHLTPGVRATLASVLERADEAVSIVLCAERGESLDRELQTATCFVSLAPPSLAERRAYLDRLCLALDPRPDADVLDAITAQAAPSRAALARDLDELWRTGALTQAGVSAFYRAEIEPLLTYLHTLANPSPLSAQVAAAEDMSGTPGAKIATIEAGLMALYAGQVLCLPDRAGLLSPVPAPKRSAIADDLSLRGAALGFEKRDFWQTLVALFAPQPMATTATLLNVLASCDQFLNDPRRPHPTARSTQRSERSRRQEVSGARHLPASAGGHLTISDARELWEAGSFLVQTHGRYFNTRIDLRHLELGLLSQKTVGPFVTSLLRELRLRVRRRADEANQPFALYAAYVHEYADPERAHRRPLTRLVLHLPDYVPDNDLEPWLRYDWIPRRSPDCDRQRAMLYRRAPQCDDPLARHLMLLRLLTRGLDPNARTPQPRSGAASRLVDALGVPLHRRGPIGRPPSSQIRSVSREIDAGARGQEDREGIPVLSIWKEGAWRLLSSDFCQREYALRQEEAKSLRALETAYPDRDGMAAKKKRIALLQNHKQQWINSARERIARMR